MSGLLSKYEQAIGAADNPQLFAFDSRERFECRTGRAAAI
jgi:hypothetical protein